MNTRLVIVLIGISIVFLSVATYIVVAYRQPPLSAATIDSISVAHSQIVVQASGLTKVELWITPLSTTTESRADTLLGTALLSTSTAAGDTWTFTIPRTPIRAAVLYVKGFARGDQSIVIKHLAAANQAALNQELWGTTQESYDTWVDSGRTFVYSPGDTFSVVLDGTRYPKRSLVCTPAGVIAPASTAVVVKAPLYATTFRAFTASAGTQCWLTSDDFSILIRVLPNRDATTTFADVVHHFTLTYPLAVTLSPGSIGDMFVTQSLARFELPHNDERGTNLGEAAVLVGVSSEPSKVQSCLVAEPDEQLLGEHTIGTDVFSTFVRHDAGAGNRYDTTSYRIVHDGMCYEVAAFIHYGVFENYDPGAVHAFDQVSVQQQLDAIIAGFRFSD